MRRKFVIWVTAINLMVMIAVVGITLNIINDDYKNSVLESLEKQCALANELFNQSDDYTETTKIVGELSENRVTVIASSGEVIADSEVDASTLGSHDTREEVQNARKDNGIGYSTRYSDTLKKDVMYVAMPIDDNGTIVRIAQPLENIWEYISAMWQSIAIIIVIAILIITLFTIWIMNRIVSPITQLIEATNEITNGNLKKRVYVRGEKEINELAHSLNEMTEELDKAIGDLKNENTKLETVLNAIGNGIIAVNNKMRIIMLNNKAKDILHLEDDALFSNVLTASRNASLESLLMKCIKEKSSFKKEVKTIEENKEIKLLFSVAPIERENKIIGAVAVIEDVTELRKLETVRSEFAANVSHELKTPLTIIRGFVETLKDGAINDDKKTEKFLDIISIETDRLSRLISDILYLSEIESDSIKVEMNKLDLAESAKEVVNMLSHSAKEKGVSVEVISNESVFIKGNRDRIKQMIINLVDNAIKYTGMNGTVKVYVYNNNGYARLEVEDTGPGIPQKDLSRLFERFYRSDKSRSRELGGTGLGLAIVKHIALSHGGEVSVESKLKEGSTFKIRIPEYKN